MPVRVEFDEKLTQWAGGSDNIVVEASSIHAALLAVSRAHPEFQMFTPGGELIGINRVERNGRPAIVKEELVDGDVLRLCAGPGID